MIQAHPIFGVGPQRIHTEFPNYYHGREFPSYYGHLENNMLQLAAERGLLCLAAFFWFIFELYASLISIVRTEPDEVRWPAVSALAALTGFLIAGLFEYNFGDSEVLLLLLFIVSVPFGLKGTANRPAPEGDERIVPSKTFQNVQIVAK
jgi:O-antigen ligase